MRLFRTFVVGDDSFQSGILQQVGPARAIYAKVHVLKEIAKNMPVDRCGRLPVCVDTYSGHKPGRGIIAPVNEQVAIRAFHRGRCLERRL